jgi:lipopolysaccharide heptosyltransferase II
VTAPPKGVSLEPGARVLVTRLDYLGDIVISTATVDALHERWPGIEVDYLACRPAVGILEGETRISRVHSLSPGAGIGETVRLSRALRDRRYAAVLDLYSNPRSAWLSRLSGAPVRVGLDRPGRRLLYTHPVNVSPDVREATRHQLTLASALGVDPDVARAPVLRFGDDELARAEDALTAAGAARGPLRVGLHPGGKWEVKRWPAGAFAKLGMLLQEQLGATVVVLTGPNEKRYTDAVRNELGEGARYMKPLAIRETAAVIASLDAMVVSDGGIMHTSVAAATPTVGIFGSAEPGVWFPYEALGPYRAAFIDLECRPCHQHVCPLGHTNCINGLGAGQVLSSVQTVLALRRAVGD